MIHDILHIRALHYAHTMCYDFYRKGQKTKLFLYYTFLLFSQLYKMSTLSPFKRIALLAIIILSVLIGGKAEKDYLISEGAKPVTFASYGL